MTQDYSELDRLTKEIGLTLYTQEEWDKAAKEADERGFSLDFNLMREEGFAATYEKHPELFDGISYINSEDGFPLWVREGVEWIPDHELDDDDDDVECDED